MQINDLEERIDYDPTNKKDESTDNTIKQKKGLCMYIVTSSLSTKDQEYTINCFISNEIWVKFIEIYDKRRK